MKMYLNGLFTLALVLSFQLTTHAQNTSIGIKGGLLGSNFSTSATDDFALGFRAGVFLTHSIVRDFGVGIEANYARKGSPFNQENLKLNYVEIPLLAHYFFGKGSFRPKVFVGPYYGYLLSAQLGNEDRQGYEQNDYGVLGGVGFHQSLGDGKWLYVDARYTHGLAAVVNGGDATNRDVSINVGISFPLHLN